MESVQTETGKRVSRRERRHAETMAEVIRVSRHVVASHPPGLSIRAVAAEMGMSAPALYRYVANHSELVALAVQDILAEVHEVLGASVAPHRQQDPGLALVLGVTAFREWALTHSEEFALVFADHRLPLRADGARSWGRFLDSTLADAYMGACAKYQVMPPTPPQLVVGGALEIVDDLGIELTAGTNWHLLSLWLRLYGVITLEVFRQLDPALSEGGVVFMAALGDLAAELNFGEDTERMLTAARQTLTEDVLRV